MNILKLKRGNKMTKGQEIIEELGFKLPELDCVENALEIFFQDRFGQIHGRFGWEAIRWRENGVSTTHPDKFNLVKVNWYDTPSNFPCLVKNNIGNIFLATNLDGSVIRFNNGGQDKIKNITPLKLEEIKHLILKEGDK